MRDKIDILELNRAEFENSKVKNAFIRESDKEWIGFTDKAEAGGEELHQILEGDSSFADYDVIVFGENVPEYADFISVIESVDIKVYALAYKRRVMESIGCFNEKLVSGIDYEFLCRASELFNMCFVSCASENVASKANIIDAKTLAYVLKKNMVNLQKDGRLNTVFGKFVNYCTANNSVDEFNGIINEFLGGSVQFEEINKNTAPFYMIMGDDTCNGVLRDFAVQLLEGLVSLGQAVVTSKGNRGRQVSVNEMDKVTWKGIVGFQAPVLEKTFFQMLGTRKFQFWFDNPAFFDDMFNGDDNYYLLCQDKFYAEHICKYYGLKNAMQFPPAGKAGDYFNNDNKLYDVVFIGTYNKLDFGFKEDDFKASYYEYMIANPELTFEEGLQGILAGDELLNDEQRFKQLLYSLSNVCRAVISFYRKKVVETILAAGINLHVYGDSWKNFDGQGKENLIIHPAVTPDEAMEIMSRAKISLNVMTWHKAGMTERIANSMLAGAVCLSDETVYLRDNFSRDEIVLFELNHLEELSDKIKMILDDEDLRCKIAKKAYEKACSEHTWRKRAEQLVELAEEY